MIDVCIVMIQKFKDYIYEQHCKGKHLDAEKVFRDLKATTQYFQWAGYESEEKTFVGYIEHLEKENEDARKVFMKLIKDVEKLKSGTTENDTELEIEHFRQLPFIKKKDETENDTELEIEHFLDLDSVLYPEGLDWTYDKPNEPHKVVYIIKKKEEESSSEESEEEGSYDL